MVGEGCFPFKAGREDSKNFRYGMVRERETIGGWVVDSYVWYGKEERQQVVGGFPTMYTSVTVVMH
jgi:hypothetical protein